MPDFRDFLPLRTETVETIRARMDADVNAGLLASDPRYLDTTEGGFYHDFAQAFAIELARLWDFAAYEVIAMTFPSSAMGVYLDYHGETLGLPRKPAAFATGAVTFTTANADATVIGAGTRVATIAVTPDSDAQEYVVTGDGGTIPPGGGSLTLPIVATESGSQGNTAANTVQVILTPTPGTVVTNVVAITGGADIESDEAYRERVMLAFVAAQGAGTIADYERWALSYPGVGYATVTPTDPAPGYVRLVVTDINNDPVSATVVSGLQTMLDPWLAETTLSGSTTLPTATITVPSTAGFTDSGVLVIGDTPHLVTYTGKTATTFTGATGGTGTQPAGTAVRQGGQASGEAPVGVTVLVQTPTADPINVVATVDFEEGYSLTGAAGTIARQDALEASVRRYLDTLKPGEDVIRNKVIAAIVAVEGVDDVTLLTLDGGAGNVVIGALVVAQSGTFAWSAA